MSRPQVNIFQAAASVHILRFPNRSYEPERQLLYRIPFMLSRGRIKNICVIALQRGQESRKALRDATRSTKPRYFWVHAQKIWRRLCRPEISRRALLSFYRTFRPCNDSSRHAPSAHRQIPKLHLCCQGGDTCVYPLLENLRQLCAEKVPPRVAPPVYPNRGLYYFTQTPLPIRVRRHETPGAIRVTLPIPPIPRERRA